MRYALGVMHKALPVKNGLHYAAHFVYQEQGETNKKSAIKRLPGCSL